MKSVSKLKIDFFIRSILIISAICSVFFIPRAIYASPDCPNSSATLTVPSQINYGQTLVFKASTQSDLSNCFYSIHVSATDASSKNALSDFDTGAGNNQNISLPINTSGFIAPNAATVSEQFSLRVDFVEDITGDIFISEEQIFTVNYPANQVGGPPGPPTPTTSPPPSTTGTPPSNTPPPATTAPPANVNNTTPTAPAPYHPSINNICTPDQTSAGYTHNIARCINNLYITAVALAGFGAVFMLSYAGYLYITGGQETIQTAKSIFGSTITALAILFATYAILNTIDPNLTNINAVVLRNINCSGGDNCVIPPLAIDNNTGLPAGTGTTAGGGSSACVNTEQKGCTKAIISQCPAMAANMDAALRACNQESGGGITTIGSTVDKCTETTTNSVISFSWGLWQINVAAGSYSPEFDNECKGVLSQAGGPWGQLCVDGTTCGRTCTFGSGGAAAFKSCTDALGDPARNTKQACTLFNQRGWNPWPYTKKVCSLP
jgi:hypothetical protein